MAATLRPSEISAIATADRTAVVAALSQVIARANGPWLPPSHTAENGIEISHHPSGPTPISHSNLAEYLAVAAPNHCLDGWTYLSRALNSYLLGDAHSSWHFAYYAELRAAQSILSASGFGAFDSWNATVNSSGQINLVDAGTRGTRRLPTGQNVNNALGTHNMVWIALPAVVSASNSGNAALQGMAEVFGISLAELVGHAFPGQAPNQLAAKWLSDWTFDIGMGLTDKLFRNRCSYDPHILTPHNANLGDAVSFLEDFWDSLQPSPDATFLDLDKHILRAAFVDQATQKLQRALGQTPNVGQLNQEIESAYQRMCSAEPPLSCVSLEFFLNYSNELILLKTSRDSAPAPQDPQPVLARATLLLRMATGLNRKLLLDAGYAQGTELDFWLRPNSISAGLVNSFDEIKDDRASLYLNCAIAKEDLVNAFCSTGVGETRAAIFSLPHVKPHAACQASSVIQWALQP